MGMDIPCYNEIEKKLEEMCTFTMGKKRIIKIKGKCLNYNYFIFTAQHKHMKNYYQITTNRDKHYA
jgi:hypothetical protein